MRTSSRNEFLIQGCELLFSSLRGKHSKSVSGRRNPQSMGSTVQDWLNYVCATGGDIAPTDGTAPVSLDRPRSESVTGTGKASGKDRRSSYTGGLRYEHETEAIFAIPKFEVEFCSEHDMPMASSASKWVRRRKRGDIRDLKIYTKSINRTPSLDCL